MPISGSGFRDTTAADAGLWEAMDTYQCKWGDMTTVSWVRAYAEEGGVETNDHEKQNKKADTGAEGAYAHPDPPLYREGYCSQFETLWDATIGGKVVTHKMGATVLRYLQMTQYIR